jgi:phosphoribosyl-ATP pyrophosphohydrolase/phosphoribosyl-AMP cyclohydrolase
MELCARAAATLKAKRANRVPRTPPDSLRGVFFFFRTLMDFTKLSGLVPAVVQDDATNEVLMVGFMNEAALARTQETGFVTFFSRTRGELWTKGETSGNRLRVERLLVDCDDDTLLVRVTRLGDGNVCHTGTRSCFTREL